MGLPFYIASDHAGFELKTRLQSAVDLAPYGRVWQDLGPASSESVDYPVYAKILCEKVLGTFDREQLLTPCGILICGSGVGVSIASNRFAGVRAVLAWNEDIAKLSRQHNATNVLCLGQRLTTADHAERIVHAWFKTNFEGGRHERRLDLIESDSKKKG